MSWKGVILAAFVLGIAVMVSTTRATTEENSTLVTFNKDVLPVLQKNCQTCHRPGEIAPMSFLTYKDTRPWAKAMKTAVSDAPDAALVRRSGLRSLRQRQETQRVRTSRPSWPGRTAVPRRVTRKINLRR